MESCRRPHIPAGLHGDNGNYQLEVAHRVKENIGKYAESGGS